MRLSWALLAFLESAAAVDVYAAVAAKDCSGSVGCKGYYRAFAVSTSPPNSAFEPVDNVTGVSVAAIGAQVNAANGTFNGRVDVGGFRFKTPADNSDSNKGLSFYFGYLGATGTWDSSSQTGAMAGALAEVVSTLSSINVYYDNDGTTGFKWDLTAAAPNRYDVFNCPDAATKGYDCLDPKGSISLASLTWTPIAHTKVQCNTVASLSDAPAGCEIHSLTTSGSNSSISANPIITFTARIASQPVLINNVRHGPDYAKFDVTVAFPWSAYSADLYSASTARLALIAFSAGKSGAFIGAAKKTDDGADSLVFAASGTGQQSHYSYTNTATIDGQAGPVTTQIITGQQILDFTCPIGSPCVGLTATGVIAAYLKLTVGWLQGFGWKSSITIHSLGSTAAPANVFWDPEVGAGQNTNSAAMAIPSMLVFVAALLLQ